MKHELIYIELLYYKFELPKYLIKSSRFVRLEVRAIRK
jgi:hypothetical protein